MFAWPVLSLGEGWEVGLLLGSFECGASPVMAAQKSHRACAPDGFCLSVCAEGADSQVGVPARPCVRVRARPRRTGLGGVPRGRGAPPSVGWSVSRCVLSLLFS